MIYRLTFAAYCFAHLGDIAASVWAWLCTPFSSYEGRHRNGWRLVSNYDLGVESHREQRARYAIGEDTQWLPVVVPQRIEQIPAPLCPPMYPAFQTLANHGRLRLALKPAWRVDSGELPVARIGELVRS